MRILLTLVLSFTGTSVFAETVFARNTIRAREVISADAVFLKKIETAGAAQSLEDVIGSEAKRAIYAGQPVLVSNITQAAAIERNEVVTAIFELNGLTISTEARALERGAVGDVIRAMNLTSRNTIRAEVMAHGSLRVLP